MIMRYVLIGAFNTAVSYLIYCIFIYSGVNYAVASLGALVFGVVLSFFTLGRYVFMSRLEGRFKLFVLVWVVLYFFNIGIIRLLLSFSADAYQAGLVAAVPTVGLAFLLQRFYVFRR
jgi:putative flippase GtrA